MRVAREVGTVCIHVVLWLKRSCQITTSLFLDISKPVVKAISIDMDEELYVAWSHGSEGEKRIMIFILILIRRY